MLGGDFFFPHAFQSQGFACGSCLLDHLPRQSRHTQGQKHVAVRYTSSNLSYKSEHRRALVSHSVSRYASLTRYQEALSNKGGTLGSFCHIVSYLKKWTIFLFQNIRKTDSSLFCALPSKILMGEILTPIQSVQAGARGAEKNGSLSFNRNLQSSKGFCIRGGFLA